MAKEKPKKGPKLRTVDPDELEEMLDLHEKWLSNGCDTDGPADFSHTDLSCRNLSGRKLQQAIFTGTCLCESFLFEADLTGANLSDADLMEADLAGATFVNANLSNADLTNTVLDYADLRCAKLNGDKHSCTELVDASLISANLDDADLSKANFSRANLQEAKLRGADLRKAKLENANLEAADFHKSKLFGADISETDLRRARNLRPEQLAGTNLRDTKIPRPWIDFADLAERVEESSGLSRRLFANLIIACLYTFVAVKTTLDSELVSNSGSLRLPFAGLEIPLVGFYIVAPLLLLCMYVYFQYYLTRHWELVTTLPATFPGGRGIHRNIHPWLMNSLILGHSDPLKDYRGPLYWVQYVVLFALAYLAVPAALWMFWAQFLSRHELFWTGWHVGLLTLCLGCGCLFYMLARSTLNGSRRMEPVRRRWKPIVFVTGAVIVSATVFGCFSSWEIINLQRGFPFFSVVSASVLVEPPVYSLLKKLGFEPVAYLVEQDVSIPPSGWNGDPSDLDLVKGADLQGRDLQRARARRAFLVNADMRKANLSYADFTGADMRKSDLTMAVLEGTILHGAKVSEANLLEANLSGAELHGVNFKKAKHLTVEQLNTATGNSATMLPDYIDRSQVNW
ncbi:MAG: pentapeptide repeat-containing protein [candidate division Zixibacteria bacterium]|nr:pentapeptide repeat-containing protein [candidate division Zixibacteria bacterium]MDH3938567.1 pentapeptide repeat-containing protein [candidate division Zixibacteria bacterium]MDH4034749.1 pentapeptide repeat-containing protein [candidate division Zixibacteria bacterium]